MKNVGDEYLYREPWRGGQICGYQSAYGLPWSHCCPKYKKLGSPVCEEHDEWLRLDTEDGILPRFDEGNARGLKLESSGWNNPEHAWVVADDYDDVVESGTRDELRESYGFVLAWEPEKGDVPVKATPEEIEAHRKLVEN